MLSRWTRLIDVQGSIHRGIRRCKVILFQHRQEVGHQRLAAAVLPRRRPAGFAFSGQDSWHFRVSLSICGIVETYPVHEVGQEAEVQHQRPPRKRLHGGQQLRRQIHVPQQRRRRALIAAPGACDVVQLEAGVFLDIVILCRLKGQYSEKIRRNRKIP